MADVFLGIGGNEGDREGNIKKALDMLNRHADIRITAVSSLYETKPVGTSRQPDYINGVVRIETGLHPHALLKVVKSIEGALGRQPDTHSLPRPIDIDILLYDDIRLDSLELMIPHSRLKIRRFVLEPILEIDPNVIDPVSSTPLKEFLDDVTTQEMEKIKDASEVWNG